MGPVPEHLIAAYRQGWLDGLLQLLEREGAAWQEGGSGAEPEAAVLLEVISGTPLAGTTRFRLSAADLERLLQAAGPQGEETAGEKPAEAAAQQLMARWAEKAAEWLGPQFGEVTLAVSPQPSGIQEWLQVESLRVREGEAAIAIGMEMDQQLSDHLAQFGSEGPAASAGGSQEPALFAEHSEAAATAAAAVCGDGVEQLLRQGNLDLLLETELAVSLRFGRRQASLREVIDLASGSVLELDRRLEEPVELLLNGRTIARGEVVVIDDNYGLRITEVVSPQQRAQSL